MWPELIILPPHRFPVNNVVHWITLEFAMYTYDLVVLPSCEILGPTLILLRFQIFQLVDGYNNNFSVCQVAARTDWPERKERGALPIAV